MLEARRNKDRRELFDKQDKIDARREEMIVVNRSAIIKEFGIAVLIYGAVEWSVT